MKKFGLVFPLALIIAVLALKVLSFADVSLPVPEGFSVKLEATYVQINVEPAANGQYIQIERSRDSDKFQVIATLGPGKDSYKDNNIQNGHIYKYRARRYDLKDNTSPYTREIEVISLYPIDLIISGSYSNQINLEWNYPDLKVPESFQYETVIERKDDNSGWKEIYRAPFYQREYRDNDLNPDTVYYYRIRTRYPDGTYSRYIPSPSGTGRRTGLPYETSLTGFAISDTRIRLEWDREPIEGYTVDVQRLNGFGEYDTIYSSVSADYYIDTGDDDDDTGLEPGEEYTYRLLIRKKSSGSPLAYSNVITVKTETIPSPSQLTAIPVAHGRITLTWEYPLDVESGFEIWRKEDGKTWELLDVVPRNTTDWTDYSAQTDTIYRYRVRAIRGESVYSRFVVTDPVNNAEPVLPGELLFSSRGDRMLIGSDEPAPEGVTYMLEVREGINAPWRDHTLVQPGKSLMVYFSPVSGKEYDFRLRSENKGNIVYGPVYHMPGYVPEAPTGLRVASMGSSLVLLSWNDNSKTEDGYRIYRVEGQRRTLIGTTGKDVTSFADTAAISGATVSYEVCAYNLRGESTRQSIQVTVPQKVTFKDLDGYPWCVDAVNALAASGVISQNPDGLFRPGANITRAECITILLKSFGIVPDSEYLFTVKDLTPNQWYYPYMMTAVKMGIVIPDENGYVKPLGTVTKAEMAIFMNRLLEARKQTLYTINVGYLDKFTDGYLVPDDLKLIISSLAGYGIMPAQDSQVLNLDRPATRAEAAVILYRFSSRYHRW
ncbi:MAG TPA: S-layer homology domain-containing protein [Thermoclostridium caenicola]|nr:S-layer homology domain-containing protein [Thermoclostridium caenicola]